MISLPFGTFPTCGRICPAPVSYTHLLQDGEVTRVGSTKTKKVAVRLIAATNRNLKKMIQEKTFREDLYYRLNVISINIPPLRERRDDIPPLAELFIKQLNKKYHTQKKVSETFLLELMSMSWPGTVSYTHLAQSVSNRPVCVSCNDAQCTVRNLNTFFLTDFRHATNQYIFRYSFKIQPHTP